MLRDRGMPYYRRRRASDLEERGHPKAAGRRAESGDRRAGQGLNITDRHSSR